MIAAASPIKPPPRWLGINRQSEQALGLVAWWPASPSSGSVDKALVDVIGQRTMTPTGSPAVGTVSRFLGPGTSIGPSNYMSGSDAGLPAGSSARTIAQWFRLDTIPSIDRYTFTYGTLAGNQWLTIGIYGGVGGNQWIISNASVAALSSGYTVAAGSIYHIVFTYGGGTDFHFYVNGVEVSMSGWPGSALATALSGAVSISNYQTMSATVFDTRIYDRAISAAEVARQYDHRTRWELYRRPARYGRKAGGGGGSGSLLLRRRRMMMGVS